MEPRRAAGLADLSPLSGLRSPIRRRLYEAVADAGRAIGRDEAAASAGTSRSLAAYHLDKLVAAGLLEADFARQRERGGPGAGRPSKLYRRARREFVLRAPPRDYQLLGELIVRAAEEDTGGIVRETLERVAHEYGRSLGEDTKQDAVDRDALRHALRERGYEPFDDEDGTLRLRNCPFESVAKQCPEVVCSVNLRLLEGLLEGLDVRDVHAVLEPDERHCCVVLTSAAAERRDDRGGSSARRQ